MMLWGDSTDVEKCNLYHHLAPAENEKYTKSPASYRSHYEPSASHSGLLTEISEFSCLSPNADSSAEMSCRLSNFPQ